MKIHPTFKYHHNERDPVITLQYLFASDKFS